MNKMTDRRQFGTPVWKYMDYDRSSLKTMLNYFLPIYVVLLALFPYLFYHLLPFCVAFVASIVVIIGVLLLMEQNLKENLLGPSIYSNGVSLVSKNPFRFHGRFIEFSEIKLVRIGLDDSVSDLAFLQRYLDNLGSRFVSKAEEAIEDMFGTIFLELRTEEIVELGSTSEEERFISILEDRNVEYVVSQEVQKWMEVFSEDWEG